jgi:hypothetical protein
MARLDGLLFCHKFHRAMGNRGCANPERRDAAQKQRPLGRQRFETPSHGFVQDPLLSIHSKLTHRAQPSLDQV